MKIYLVQHGEAVDKNIDPERPLTEQGKFRVQRIAEVLTHAGVEVRQVVHSGKLRARQTAEILANTIDTCLQLETSDLIKPNHDPRAFGLQVNSWSSNTIVVGHLPFMAKLVSLLVTGDDLQTLVTYQPGSVVCLEHVEINNWQIDWMLKPELLGN